MPVLSQTCERNKGPILDVLIRVFADRSSVLEIGSGTGQHALYFAENLPYLVWQPSDFGDYLPNLKDVLASSDLANIPDPIELDVRDSRRPTGNFDAVFSANTLHIMSASSVEKFFRLVGDLLDVGGVLAIYGPFNYDGGYSSPSNQKFDQWLAAQNPQSGIRDFEVVNELAKKQGFSLIEDNPMPANNQCIVWQK